MAATVRTRALGAHFILKEIPQMGVESCAAVGVQAEKLSRNLDPLLATRPDRQDNNDLPAWLECPHAAPVIVTV